MGLTTDTANDWLEKPSASGDRNLYKQVSAEAGQRLAVEVWNDLKIQGTNSPEQTSTDLRSTSGSSDGVEAAIKARIADLIDRKLLSAGQIYKDKSGLVFGLGQKGEQLFADQSGHQIVINADGIMVSHDSAAGPYTVYDPTSAHSYQFNKDGSTWTVSSDQLTTQLKFGKDEHGVFVSTDTGLSYLNEMSSAELTQLGLKKGLNDCQWLTLDGMLQIDQNGVSVPGVDGDPIVFAYNSDSVDIGNGGIVLGPEGTKFYGSEISNNGSVSRGSSKSSISPIEAQAQTSIDTIYSAVNAIIQEANNGRQLTANELHARLAQLGDMYAQLGALCASNIDTIAASALFAQSAVTATINTLQSASQTR